MRSGLRVPLLLYGLCASLALGPVRAADIDTPPPVPLRAGDVVLRHGTGLWSRLFAQLNRHDQRFSHAGIVVLDDHQQWRVVHAEVDDLAGNGRVRLDTWGDFIAQGPRVALLRVNDERTADRIADAALAMHGDKLAFDLTFDLSRTDAVYCTELVWRALTVAAGRDPLPVKAQVNGRDVVLVENLLHDMQDLTLVYATN